MSTRKHSRERRSSKRSVHSNLERSLEGGSKQDLATVFLEKKLQKILEQEEQDLIIYSVREDLMTRVMEECEKKYIEQQSVKFVVHCAYRALVQLVHLGLFNHDPGKPFYLGHPAWKGDQPYEPSPADTWAANKVAIKPKPPPETVATVSADDDFQLSQAIVVQNIFGTEVEATPSEGDLHVLYEASTPSGLRLDGTTDMQSVSGLIAPTPTEASVLEEEDELSQVPSNSISIFTHTTRMQSEHLPQPTKSGRSKIKGLVDSPPQQPQFTKEDVSASQKYTLTSLRKEVKCRKVKLPSNEDVIEKKSPPSKNSEN